MTESNTDHFRALILALPQNSDTYTPWDDVHVIFKRHARVHYPSRRPGREGFEVYPGTREQQQFDFEFVHNCESERWHQRRPHSQRRWNLVSTSTMAPMDAVLVYAASARDVALKGTLELKHGMESVEKR